MSKTHTKLAKAAAGAAAPAKKDLIRVTGLPAGRTLRVIGVTATERLSQPYEVYVELRPGKPSTFDLDAFATSLIHKPIGVAIRASQHAADAERLFHGEVAGVHLNDSGDEEGVPHVVLELRPTLWRLSRAANTRHFTNKTAKAIISTVLDEHQLAGKYKWHDAPGRELLRREHCWQYRETDLRFAQRLMEEEGYQYWFTHTAGGHTLHIGAGPEHLPKFGGTLELGKIGPDAKVSGYVGMFRRSFTAAPAAYFVEGRSADGMERMPGSASGALLGASGAIHDPDGALATVTISKAEAARRLHASTANARTADGLSDVRAFTAGTIAKIAGRKGRRPVTYRMIGVRHEATQATGIYSNRFDAVPADAAFALQRRFAKPCIPGSTTATVAEGPNALGQYRLKFDLDRKAAPSGWVPLRRDVDRLVLPRFAQRVLVGFIEGDPDRPEILRLADPASQWPFDPAENPLLGGIVTPLHELLFHSDTKEPWVKSHIRGESEDIVEKSRHLHTAADRVETIGGDADWFAEKNVNWSAQGTVAWHAGKNFEVEADSILFKGKNVGFMVDGNFVAVTRLGVTVNGTLVQLNPPGASGPASPAAAKAKAKHEPPRPRPAKPKEGK